VRRERNGAQAVRLASEIVECIGKAFRRDISDAAADSRR
jgi:hypothetical protein